MSTKSFSLSTKYKHDMVFGSDTSKNQFNNISLNQNHKCLSPVPTVYSKILASHDNKNLLQDYGITESKPKQGFKSSSLNKIDSNINLTSNLFSNHADKIEMNNSTKISSSSSKNSTLSLHIAAYENSNEFKNTKNEKSLKLKNGFVSSSVVIQNPFEFPRQQKEATTTKPEIAQFKASQKLYNPNELCASNNHQQQQQPRKFLQLKMMDGECFVTVGSTQFDDLIQAVLSLEVKKALKNVGINKLVIQCGAGKAINLLVPDGLKDADKGCFVEEDSGLKIEYFRYKNSIHDNMKSATLIIGHAGAGTCLESLKLHKPMITVVNDKLMDNHQTELADRLAELGHLICTTPSQLHKALTNENLLSPKTFEPSKPNLFSNYLYSKLGYVVTD